MANFWYDHALYLIATKQIDLATDDIRMLLVMTNTTADTERSAATFAGLTTLDEYNGSGYASPGGALASLAVIEDNVNRLVKFSSAAKTFATLGAGTRQCQAAIIYKFVTALSSSIPIAFIDTVTGTPAFPFTGNGANVVLTPAANGWMNLQA